MKNLMKSFRELNYFELLGMNGGYGGGSGGGSKSGGSGYSGGSGGSSGGASNSSKKNPSGRKTGYTRFISSDVITKTTGTTNAEGYIFYDWEGDGKFDHIEYCEVDANGAGYSFYNNNGYEKDEKYYHRYFMEDNNAGAKPNSTGKLKFVALN